VGDVGLPSGGGIQVGTRNRLPIHQQPSEQQQDIDTSMPELTEYGIIPLGVTFTGVCERLDPDWAAKVDR
jgi:hypothetical protein